jgi:acetyltransferase
MQGIFYPHSVAVVGVSSRPANMGKNIVNNLVEFGFDGVVYAVGPGGGVIQTRRIYPSVLDIPDQVDLAIILTPARAVPAILEQCGQKGVRRAIIESAGFREYGQEGMALEAQVVDAARRHNIRFVGPNGIGVINMENGFCSPFPPFANLFRRGPISIVAQSGGVGISVLQLITSEGMGLNKFVSVGNMLDITAEDLTEYLIGDDGTEIIFLYLESIADGRRLMQLGRASDKPILAFKANTGQLGRSIAASHTAALSSDDQVVDAALRQAGILRVYDASSLSNTLKALRLPPLRGKNLAVISRSGGHAVIAADTCEAVGLDLAPFPERFLREIESHFRASVIRLTNPVDLGDLFDLDVYAQIVEQTLQLPGVDGVLVMHTAAAQEHEPSRLLMDRLNQLQLQYDKPVAYYLSAAPSETTYLKQTRSYPLFTQVVETVRALEASFRHHRQLQRIRTATAAPVLDLPRPALRALIERAQRSGRSLLLPEALGMLELVGIATAPGQVAHSVPEARAAAKALGYPVVIKAIAHEISHKSDVGGIRLNLHNDDEVAAAFNAMVTQIGQSRPDVTLDGVLVQPMVTGGQELILGGRQDPVFGPVVLIGLGGILVELLGEVAIRVAPIDRLDAEAMISSLRAAAILRGVRGQPGVDVSAVIDALLRIGQLLSDFPEIREIDVNPLLAQPAGEKCLALDARVIL